MKKIATFFAATLIASTMGCINSRAQMPSTITVKPRKYSLPIIYVINNTDYHISITTPNIDSVIALDAGETDSICLPDTFYPPKFCQLSLIAWDKDGFPMGSASREIKILKHNPTNTVPIWIITNKDLQY